MAGIALVAALVMVVGVAGTVPAAAAPESRAALIERKAAVLQGLDKITARISTFEVVVGGTASFGSLLITVRACREAPPIEPPEAAAFLEIRERIPGEAEERLFNGWMFASSPALSALEHPVYDIWVKSCGGR
ncbi:DUF2155 domain-containing protein [uncultured Gammaproteobacteria bacterium]